MDLVGRSKLEDIGSSPGGLGHFDKACIAREENEVLPRDVLVQNIVRVG